MWILTELFRNYCEVINDGYLSIIETISKMYDIAGSGPAGTALWEEKIYRLYDRVKWFAHEALEKAALSRDYKSLISLPINPEKQLEFLVCMQVKKTFDADCITRKSNERCSLSH
jgi:hypothetical protein